MSIMGAAWILYGIIAALVACRMTSILAWRQHVRYVEREQRRGHPYLAISAPSGDDYAGFGLLAVGTAPVWPLVLLAYALRAFLFAPPRDVRVKLLKKRNEELERELELR